MILLIHTLKKAIITTKIIVINFLLGVPFPSLISVGNTFGWQLNDVARIANAGIISFKKSKSLS